MPPPCRDRDDRLATRPDAGGPSTDGLGAVDRRPLLRATAVAGALLLVAACNGNPVSAGAGGSTSTHRSAAHGAPEPTAAPATAAVALTSTPSTVTTSATAAVTTVASNADPTTTVPAGPATTPAPVTAIKGMAPVIDSANLYSEAGPGKPSGAPAASKQYVYVPSDRDGSVTVIDQATFQVVGTLSTGGKLVQHVVPGFDLQMLYANVSGSNFLREIDPTTGELGGKIPVDAPYNLYFTPDGTRALVMAERRNRIDVYDRTTWKLLKKVPVPCQSHVRGQNYGGVNHADWSIDGRYFLATCEFAGRMIKVDTETIDVVGTLDLEGAGATRMAMPQDVRITPDGRKFYVADMMNDGVWVVDGETMTVVKRIDTGKGAHGIYPSRDGSVFYVANRGRFYNETENRPSKPGEGSVSVIDWRTDTVTTTWPISDGGSPDMGGVSADGKTLWLSGRYDAEVYAIDTSNGQLRARIGTPGSPHGLCVFPQPGRYSLGHTGNYR